MTAFGENGKKENVANHVVEVVELMRGVKKDLNRMEAYVKESQQEQSVAMNRIVHVITFIFTHYI